MIERNEVSNNIIYQNGIMILP